MKKVKEVYAHDLAKQPFIDIWFFELVNTYTDISFTDPININPLRLCLLDLYKIVVCAIFAVIFVFDIFYTLFRVSEIRKYYADSDNHGYYLQDKWILREFTK